MKNIHSCTLIIAFFIAITLGLVSCNTDYETVNSEHVNSIFSKLITTSPENDANPYDEAGSLYDELFDSYYTSGNFDGTVSQIVNRVQIIADGNANFNAIKGNPYNGVSSIRVHYLLEHPTTCVNDVISVSGMTYIGKSSLANFVNSFIVFLDSENDCDVIYQKVVDYENEVLLNSSLTVTDMRIILTTTSVVRYSTYRARKKPKKNTDPDWNIFIGNIIASTEGAEYGLAEAVTMALVTGIAQND